MATIDLGKIKQVWRGTYNNGTAYTVDDLVEYTDSGILSTYICVANSTGNAPSSSGTAHASWNYVAKGVSTATGGKVLQVVSTTDNTEIANTTGTTPYNYSQLNTSITPSASNSKILVQVHFGCIQYGGNDSSLGYGKIMFTSGGGSDTDLPSGLLGANNVAGSNKMQWAVNLETSEWWGMTPSMQFLHSPSTTSALVYKVFFWAESSSGNIKINQSYRNNTNDYSSVATMTCTEIGA